MTGAEATARESAPGGLSIGAVLARLKPEFPDLSISKIRFLESEELVTPQRTASGYRQFFAHDIARLRYILTAQRDHYLPLKVIKEQLDAIDGGGPIDPSTPAMPRALMVAVSGSTPSPQREARIGAAALCQESGLTEAQRAQSESFGLLQPDSGGRYGNDDVLAARTIAELISLGLEPRHLRSLRQAADREASLVSQMVVATARRRDPSARQRASADAASHAATLLRLHALLVKSALDDELGA